MSGASKLDADLGIDATDPDMRAAIECEEQAQEGIEKLRRYTLDEAKAVIQAEQCERAWGHQPEALFMRMGWTEKYSCRCGAYEWSAARVGGES